MADFDPNFEPDPADASQWGGTGRSNGTGKQPWRALDLPSLEGIPIPDRRWIVPHWLPVRVVTLCYADGGIGKTLLALQLMASTALNSRWCGIPVTPCNSIGLFSEDDATELHIRMDAIRQHYGVSWADLGDMHPVDATGQDNVLVRFQSDGTMVTTARFAQLRDEAMDIKARLVVIDTAATCFSGNESDRGQVTQFVGNALTKLAQDIDGAVYSTHIRHCPDWQAAISDPDQRHGITPVDPAGGSPGQKTPKASPSSTRQNAS